MEALRGWTEFLEKGLTRTREGRVRKRLHEMHSRWRQAVPPAAEAAAAATSHAESSSDTISRARHAMGRRALVQWQRRAR